MEKKNIEFLGVSSGICAPYASGRFGAELGFDAIRAYALKEASPLFITASRSIVSTERLYTYLKEEEKKDEFMADIEKIRKNEDTTRFARHIDYLKDIYPVIVENVEQTLNSGRFPFVIAGDHSTAAATIAGIKKHLQAKNNNNERLGVIWVDAHVDGHSPYSTPTGNMHGMPVGIALKLEKNLTKESNPVSAKIADDWNSLCLIHAPGDNSRMIEENELVYIGIRSWETHEEELLKKVRHYKLTRKYDKDAKDDAPLRRGETWSNFTAGDDEFHLKNKTLNQVCFETMKYLSDNGCTHLYVSFDIDSIDGSIVPGTGTPVPYGLGVDEAKFVLNYFANPPKEIKNKIELIAMELVEVSPLLDHGNKTAKVAFEIIKSVYDCLN